MTHWIRKNIGIQKYIIIDKVIKKIVLMMVELKILCLYGYRTRMRGERVIKGIFEVVTCEYGGM